METPASREEIRRCATPTCGETSPLRRRRSSHTRGTGLWFVANRNQGNVSWSQLTGKRSMIERIRAGRETPGSLGITPRGSQYKTRSRRAREGSEEIVVALLMGFVGQGYGNAHSQAGLDALDEAIDLDRAVEREARGETRADPEGIARFNK